MPSIERGGGTRVLLVADSLDVGGAERHVVHLAAGLVRSGWSVTIACSVAGGLATEASAAGVEVCPLIGSLVKRSVSLPYAWRLAHLTRRGHFGLTHAHMFASSVAAGMAARLTQLPLVITEHSEANWRSPRARWFSCRAYAIAARIIAVSESIRRRLITEDGVGADRVSTIHNAFVAPAHLCTQLHPWLIGDLARGPLIGVVARLQPEKGVRYFIEAARLVAADVPEARFVVIGDGPLRTSLEARAGELGLAERMRFLGFCLDAPVLIRQLDVLAVPSLSEGTPLVILEAMSAGIPIVASAVGGVPEQVRDGREALLVPPADPAALAHRVSRLLRERQLARKLSQAARQRALESFSTEVLLPHTEEVYRSACLRLSGEQRLTMSTPSLIS